MRMISSFKGGGVGGGEKEDKSIGGRIRNWKTWFSQASASDSWVIWEAKNFRLKDSWGPFSL